MGNAKNEMLKAFPFCRRTITAQANLMKKKNVTILSPGTKEGCKADLVTKRKTDWRKKEKKRKGW